MAVEGSTGKLDSIVQGIEAVRRVIGAGRNTARTPKDLESFDPQGRDIDFTEHILLGYFEPRLL